ncbi:hypothetical protein D3C74_434380 [compost metagenome]
MNQHFLTAIRHDTYCMLAGKYIEHFAVDRRYYCAVIRKECKAVACHFLGEDRVRNLCNVHELAISRHNNILMNNSIPI